MRSRTFPLGLSLVICILFFVSGATGLVYEVVWTRFFTVVYGNTTYGVSAVLTAFMGGLGLGSYFLGRAIDQKRDYLLIYALLEIGIALAAVAMPWILHSLQGFYSIIFNTFPGSVWTLQVARTLLSFSILVVPTFLMGATLPVLTKFFVSRSSLVGARIGILYGANTLGATVGAFLAGFFLIKAFGLTQTVYVTAALNVLLAAAFLVLRQLLGTQQSAAERVELIDQSIPAQHVVQPPTISPTRAKVLLICFALAGFTSLAYEVLWFRLLVFELQTTIYAFTAMLATFLAGIGLGSAVFSMLQKRTHNTSHYWDYLGYVEAAIGLLGLMSILMFGGLEYLGSGIARTFWGNVGMQFTLAAMIMLLPTLLMGAAFPIVCKILSEDVSRAGGTVGKVYAANTIGAIFGSFLTGFFLVRYFGTQLTLVLNSALNLLIASLILVLSPQVQKQAAGVSSAMRRFRPTNIGTVLGIWVVGVLGVMIIPQDYLFQYYNIGEKRHDSKVEILFAEEGLETITTVHRYPDNSRVISTGSINVAGTSFTLRTTQMLQGHIPMLLKPDAKQVLQVGFGSGETAHIITTYDNVERLDLVDISQSVLDTSAQYFRDINKDVVKNPKFHPTIMDGANYLRLTKKKYDVIMNDSIWPFYAGNSGLYTRDYFQAGKEHLNEGGIMTSWLPVEIAPEDFEILIGTFHSVFPHVSVWIAMTHYNKHALLVGSDKPIKIDVPTFLRRFDRYARDDLKLVRLDNPINLLDSFKMDETGFAAAVANSPLHTENNPILEFSYSRGKPAGNEYRVYEFIQAHMTNVLPYLVNIPGDENQKETFKENLVAASEASAHVMKGFIMRESYEKNFAEEFDKALKIWPQHPGAISLVASARQTQSITPESLAGKSFEDLGSMGQMLLKEGSPEAPAMVYEKMAEMRPDNADVRSMLGRLYLGMGRHEEAISALEVANSLDSNAGRVHELAEAHDIYGIALAKRGDSEKATQHFKESIRLEPSYGKAHGDYGILLGTLGRDDDAVKEFQEAVRLDPGNAEAHNNLGILLGRRGDIALAIEHFEKAVSLQPDNWPFHEHLAYAYYYSKQYGKAWGEVQRIQVAGKNINHQFIKALGAAMPEPAGVVTGGQ